MISPPPEKLAGRALARRQAMLDAATELFLEQGYERTSLSDIVSRSKGSRSTLYSLFGNKEGLLKAMVEDMTADIWTVVRGGGEDLPFTEESLVELGVRFTEAALAPRSVAVFRIIAAVGTQQPAIAQMYFDMGPRLVERLLGQRFALTYGEQSPPVDPERLVSVFLGAVLGVFHTRRLLGLSEDGIDLVEHVRLAVRCFLHGMALPAR